ncbi:iron-containing alcohol dehydrogenase [Eremococcus coleocola]|uniref:Alcohol dehydrogenase, iron-dependent n=1 Tax=Eremococcus coleocola ACS-139-V-Col8 TaxID=908337 RepID=E4KLS1_9LACT|nr:iron-containing alcohol dehydrogenase [Eremococcus coleocola]EFR32065.1 alcohol dehydrogenase, iron-dependent [Eremococcus coleocola ACS-139-V-Col8]
MAMKDFMFYNPTRIYFGKDQIKQIDRSIPKNAKVLILYGGGSVKKFGTFDRVVEALGNRQWGEFGGIEANPVFETLLKAVDQVKAESYNYLLAVGGGSVIDGTKFVAAASVFEGDPIDIFGQGVGQGLPIKQALPFGTVLTLPATASEMNSGSVVTFHEKKAKISFGSSLTFPVFSILEPEMTFTLPARQLANGVADGFVHTMENYLTLALHADVQDRFSEAILKTFIDNAPVYCDPDQADYEAAANIMWACTMALNGVASRGNVGDWATHALGHEVTVLNNTDHGRTLTPILLATMHVRRDGKHDKLVQYGRRIWNIQDENEELVIDKAIQKTAEFFESINMPTKLSQVGVNESDIDFLITQLEKHKGQKIGENGVQDLATSRLIYQTAL